MIKQIAYIGSDFHPRNVIDISVGDKITGLRISAMPSSRFGNTEFAIDWATRNVAGEVVDVEVVLKETFIRTGYYKINAMHFVKDQPIFIQRAGYWQWKFPHQIVTGDKLFGRDLAIQVESNLFIEANCQTYEITVDLYDTFFLNNVLVHNKIG